MPYLEGPWKLAMGLHALEPERWLWLDEHWEVEVAERRRLSLERRDLVYAVSPGSEQAGSELLETVVDWLRCHARDRFEDHPDGIVVKATGELVSPGSSDPLLVAGSIVQEDLLLLMEDARGSYRLAAGHLCFPLHWKLEDKLGKTLSEVHEPVPGFVGRLGGTVDRFFASLRADRPVWRANWSLTSSSELCLPDRSDQATELDRARLGCQLWLRVERQTLRRLPTTGAIVFTIKTRRSPLGEVAASPDVARAIAARIREMPDEMAAYKGLLRIRAGLLEWLDARSVEAKELAL